MKKVLKGLLACLALVACRSFGQTPDNLSTDIAGGTPVSYTMTNLGKFNQTRIVSGISTSSGISKWEFYSCSGGCYVSNWRPKAANLILAGYNQDVPPAAGTACAFYNSASGGFTGYLPAVTSGNYYTFNVMNTAAANEDMGVLETSFSPVTITSVKSTSNCGATVTVSATLSAAPGAGEYFYVRYSTNAFASSSVAQMTVSGTTVSISGIAAASITQFYVFSSSVNTLTSGQPEAYYDTQTLNLNNNSGSYYSYTSVPLSGTYTINSTLPTGGTNFKTIAEAVNELNTRGLGAASIVFNVNAGLTETAPAGGYVLQYCSGVTASSSAKTVTFQRSGAGANPLITAQTGTSYTSDAIFTIVGGSYITINGIDLFDPNTSSDVTEMEAGYAILQKSNLVGSTNNAIKNCTVTLKSSTYDAANASTLNIGPVGILVDGVNYLNYGTTITPNATLNACNSNAFYNNTLLNCAVGIGLNVFSGLLASTKFAQNNIIGSSGQGNIIQNFGSSGGASIYSYGIYANYQTGISIAYNTLNNTAGGGSSAACNLYGIYAGGNVNVVTTISNNTISLTAAPGAPFFNSVQVAGITSYATSATISNNTIQSCNVTTGDMGAFYGIMNGGGSSTTTTISNNTIGNSANPNTITTTNGAIYFIGNQRITTTLSITGNTIQNNNATITSANGAVQFIGNQNIVTTLGVTGNIIQNNTVSSAIASSFVWGIVNANSTVSNLTFGTAGSGNIIQGNAFNTVGNLFFIDPTYIGTKNPGTTIISNNTILSNTNNVINASPVYLVFNSATTNSVTFTNNILGNSTTPAYTESAACSGNVFGYYNAGAATGGTETITGNSLNLNLQTSGSVKGFYTNTATAQTGTITGNSIYSFINTGTGSFFGFDFELHSTASAFNNNSITGSNSLATTGGAADYGFYILAPVQNISNNTVNGITLTNSSNANLFGLYAGSTTATTPSAIYSNSISNLTANGTNFINAVQSSQTVATSNIYSNTITSINGKASQIAGIILNNTATTTNAYQNNIYNLASTNASVALAGIDATLGTTNNIYNNLISDLRAPAATSSSTLSIRGLQVDGGTNAGFYYNTVYLNASSTGANFGTAALFVNNTVTALTLEDNILVNASAATGTQASVALQTIYALAAGTAPSVSVYTTASNNNVFYTLTSGYAYADNLPVASANNKFQCSCSNITSFKAFINPRETNSFYELPPFANVSSAPYNLSLPAGSSTGCFQGGVPVGAITTIDYTGTSRNASTPTIGAYELTSGSIADKTAPAITYAAAVSNCNSNVTFTANITDAGTGVNNFIGTAPRVYYKKQSDGNNALATLNNNTVSGWKYVETSNGASPFSFTIDLGLLQGALAPGDVIQYFVIAQDKQGVPNVAVNSVSLAGCINSVALTASDFPAFSVTNSFTIPPFPQNPAVTPASVTVCQGGVQNLTASASNVSPAPTFTWSPVTNLFTDAGTTIAYVAGSNVASVYTNTSASINYISTITVGACSTSVTVPVTAASSNWTGAMNKDWNTAGNWCANVVPSSLTDVVIPGAATNQPILGLSGSNALCKSITIQPGASLTMQSSYTLSIANGGFFTNGGTFTSGSANETIAFSGSGSITGITTFNNLTLNGAVTLNNDIIINKTALLNAGSSLVLNGKSSTFVGSFSGSGTITGDNAATVNVRGATAASLGILSFTPAAQTLNTLSIDRWNGTVAANAVTLGSNISVNNLALAHGIIATGTNLFQLNSYAGLTVPGGIPWSSAQTNAYDLSYVATCDASGIPISVANSTTPLSASYGFQINNIGTGGTTGDVYFPVGATFLPAGTLITNPTPNRVSMNNSGPSDNFNIVVNYGDILNTPKARVNRIWYIHSANTTGVNTPDRVNLKLFFVERTIANWPSGENEIENTPVPFDFTNITLVEKNYDPLNANFLSIASGTDIKNFPNGPNNGKEVYAQYNVGISPDVTGNKFGIDQFYRFSVTNPGNIILPVSVIDYRAYLQNEKVINEWTTENEINLDRYEIERSADAVNFTAIGTVAANNRLQTSTYSFSDVQPLPGKNFYRIKAINKNGSFLYTNIQLVQTEIIAQSINIFPNPVINNTFSLQMNNVPAGKYILQIFNAQSQLILNREIENTGSSVSQTIMLPALTAHGEYFINLSGKNTMFYRKLNVQ